MVMTEKGKIIRMPCKDLRVISRNTQGVRLVRLEEGDKIASVEPVVDDGEEGNLPAPEEKK
jgi:DNA gyrase subunit A